ncbi:rCG26507 [Rattus norvegicus]|uniref:RCG26507 n=1 Tax=Rattus norvegicus TaxID=10116 RepID=A6HMC9_RAT|nr:rCG26507 [Rattus norvegicus]
MYSLPRTPLTHPPPHQPALRRPNVLGFNDASSLWNFTIPSRIQLGTSLRPLQPEEEAWNLAERILMRGTW